MSQAYQRTNTAVYLLNYHFVFCPARRRKVLTGKLESRLRALLESKAEEKSWNILALEIMPDHVHLFIGLEPAIAPNQAMHALKAYSSRILRKEFPYLLKMPSLWTRSFFVSTAGNVSSATIERYVKAQKTRG